MRTKEFYSEMGKKGIRNGILKATSEQLKEWRRRGAKKTNSVDKSKKINKKTANKSK